jgi:predicted nucleotidyltransferase
MYSFHPAYPTIEHEQAAQRLVEFFSQQPDVAAVILKCSCARGKATRDSCLDICILLPAEISIDRRFDLEQAWDEFHLTETVFKQLRQVGKYSHLDLDFHDGWFTPTDHEHHWTIREQIEEILELPELYPHLPNLFEIQHFESQEIARKARELEQLFGRYVV